jgi:hypothetical protein
MKLKLINRIKFLILFIINVNIQNMYLHKLIISNIHPSFFHVIDDDRLLKIISPLAIN